MYMREASPEPHFVRCELSNRRADASTPARLCSVDAGEASLGAFAAFDTYLRLELVGRSHHIVAALWSERGPTECCKTRGWSGANALALAPRLQLR